MDKREAVKAMYPKSSRWAKRVDRMSDAQVTAIYFKRLHNQQPKPTRQNGNPPF